VYWARSRTSIGGQRSKGSSHRWNRYRYGAGCALCVGIADHLVRICTGYAKQRQTFGKPIGKYQAVQWMLADSALEVHAARLMTYLLAWLVDPRRAADQLGL
jgi:alkylation response protein AidB-like acyl-CoA dehydrogenase